MSTYLLRLFDVIDLTDGHRSSMNNPFAIVEIGAQQNSNDNPNENNNSDFNHGIAKTYFERILNTLETCHNMGIIHRDLKPQNILLSSKYQIKIAHFGLSTHNHDADNKRVSLVGALGYSEITSAGGKSDHKYVYIYANDNKLFWKCHCNCRIGNNTSAATDVAICKSLLRMFGTDASKRITITVTRDHNWYKMVTGFHGDSDLEQFFQSTMENIRQQILVKQLGSPHLQKFNFGSSFDKSLLSSTATSKSNQLKSLRSPKSQFEFSQLHLQKGIKYQIH